MTGAADPPKTPRRRRLAISLRALTLLVCVAGAWMGAEKHRARMQRIAVDKIHAIKGLVEYKGRFTGGEPWAPPWLASHCDPEYFVDVRSVALQARSAQAYST
jgi:hypothetical protein